MWCGFAGTYVSAVEDIEDEDVLFLAGRSAQKAAQRSHSRTPPHRGNHLLTAASARQTSVDGDSPHELDSTRDSSSHEPDSPSTVSDDQGPGTLPKHPGMPAHASFFLPPQTRVT